jgi:hypothetical protein
MKFSVAFFCFFGCCSQVAVPEGLGGVFKC